jgi:hypothetical protein
VQLSVPGAALILAVLVGPADAREVRSLTDVVLDPDPVVVAVPEPLDPDKAAALPTLAEVANAGRHWRFETERGPIHVWIPADYDAKTAAAVVFVHGYFTDVDTAWTEYRLAYQFALSGINAMFIAGSSPANKHDTIVWPSITGLLASVAARIDVAMPTKRLAAVGHSGAYRTLATWLTATQLDTVVLLDALYGEYRFMPWVRESARHRLVNIAYETDHYSDWMHRWLPSTKRVEGLPLEGFPDSRIVYAKTDVGHWQLVTDGVALPLALRAIGVPQLAAPPAHLPLGLPLRCKPPTDYVPDPAIKAAAAALAVIDH